jgi:hypothetical protein
MASAAVVLAVGARSSGQASFSTPTWMLASASLDRVDSGLPVMAISGTWSRLMIGRMVMISPVSPEFDRASTTSVDVIMPRSP